MTDAKMIAPAEPHRGGSAAATRVRARRGSRRGRAGDAPHERAGPGRGMGERHPDLRRAAGTGLDELRVARAPRRARRHGCGRRAHRDRSAAGQRLVPRLARLHRRSVRSTATSVPGTPNSRCVFADGHVQRVVTDESWRAGDRRRARRRPLQRRDDRRPPRATIAWRHPGFDDAAWDAVHVVEFDTARLVAAHLASGSPAGRARRRARLDLALGQDARRLRAEPRRLRPRARHAARPAPRSCFGTPR